MNKEVFEAFINGSLAVPGRAIKFEQIEWSNLYPEEKNWKLCVKSE